MNPFVDNSASTVQKHPEAITPNPYHLWNPLKSPCAWSVGAWLHIWICENSFPAAVLRLSGCSTMIRVACCVCLCMPQLERETHTTGTYVEFKCLWMISAFSYCPLSSLQSIHSIHLLFPLLGSSDDPSTSSVPSVDQRLLGDLLHLQVCHTYHHWPQDSARPFLVDEYEVARKMFKLNSESSNVIYHLSNIHGEIWVFYSVAGILAATSGIASNVKLQAPSPGQVTVRTDGFTFTSLVRRVTLLWECRLSWRFLRFGTTEGLKVCFHRVFL